MILTTQHNIGDGSLAEVLQIIAAPVMTLSVPRWVRPLISQEEHSYHMTVKQSDKGNK